MDISDLGLRLLRLGSPYAGEPIDRFVPLDRYGMPKIRADSLGRFGVWTEAEMDLAAEESLTFTGGEISYAAEQGALRASRALAAFDGPAGAAVGALDFGAVAAESSIATWAGPVALAVLAAAGIALIAYGIYRLVNRTPTQVLSKIPDQPIHNVTELDKDYKPGDSVPVEALYPGGGTYPDGTQQKIPFEWAKWELEQRRKAATPNTPIIEPVQIFAYSSMHEFEDPEVCRFLKRLVLPFPNIISPLSLEC